MKKFIFILLIASTLLQGCRESNVSDFYNVFHVDGVLYFNQLSIHEDGTYTHSIQVNRDSKPINYSNKWELTIGKGSTKRISFKGFHFWDKNGFKSIEGYWVPVLEYTLFNNPKLCFDPDVKISEGCFT